MIKVALVDDEALFRKGLRMLISSMDNIKVTIESSNGIELLNSMKESEVEVPNIILLDMNMPKMDGLETYKAMREQYPKVQVVILTSHFKKAFVLYMLELGVCSFISKDTDIANFEKVIKEVHKNGFYYSKQILEIINQGFTNKIDKSSKNYKGIDLTNRESEVLNLICLQYTTKEIGQKLFISPRTVEGHRNKLLEKIGCRNIAGLVLFAIQQGIVKLSIPPKFN